MLGGRTATSMNKIPPTVTYLKRLEYENENSINSLYPIIIHKIAQKPFPNLNLE